MSRRNHTPSWPELAAILLGRLSVLWLLVLFMLTVPSDNVLYLAVMGIIFSIAVPYALWLRKKIQFMPLARQQLLVDTLLIILLIAFTGGIDSQLTLLCPLVILIAGTVGPSRQAVHITVLSMLAYLLMTATMPLIQDTPQLVKAGGWIETYSILFVHLLTAVLFGALSLLLNHRCTYSGSNKQDASVTLNTLLNHLDTGILMLDRDGSIIFSNPAACTLIHATAEQLSTRKFTDLCVSGMKPLPDQYGTSIHLARMNGPPIPAAFRKADLSLPAAALPAIAHSGNESEITLVVLSDLSRSMELEHQLERVERITAATRVAGEMAHEIRTPLTTISASIQLLQHYEKNASARDWLPNSPRKQDRIELFSHIIGASEKLDAVIRNFVDFAEFSPDDLLTIIKLDSNGENHGYIGHLNTSTKGLTHGQNSNSG